MALVLMSGTIQAAHIHPSGQIDHDCSVCVAAHHVVAIVALITLDLSEQHRVHFDPGFSIEPPRQRFFQKIASRPPPAVPTFS